MIIFQSFVCELVDAVTSKCSCNRAYDIVVALDWQGRRPTPLLPCWLQVFPGDSVDLVDFQRCRSRDILVWPKCERVNSRVTDCCKALAKQHPRLIHVVGEDTIELVFPALSCRAERWGRR